MFAFSAVSDFSIRLPSSDVNQTRLNLVVTVRDTLDCVVSVNLSTVVVSVDVSSISELVDQVSSSSNAVNGNSLARLLSSGNQNTVSQVITSLSQYFNQIDRQSTDDAVSQGGVPLASISVSSLSSATFPQVTDSVFETWNLCISDLFHRTQHPRTPQPWLNSIASRICMQVCVIT